MQAFAAEHKAVQRSAGRAHQPAPAEQGRSPQTETASVSTKDVAQRAHAGWDFGGIDLRSAGEGTAGAFAVDRPVRAIAERGVSGAQQALPYLTEIQRAFGRHDVSGIAAHRDSRAERAAGSLRARAYALGNHVGFGRVPDLWTATHEAAHVVQQRSGVRVDGGIGRAGDRYERHAEAVADLVVRRRSAEALLDGMAPVGRAASASMPQVVQRAPIQTDYGTFDTTLYNSRWANGREIGLNIDLAFDPDHDKVDAKKIEIVQDVRSVLAGKPVALSPASRNRMVPSGPAAGTKIDQLGRAGFRNPMYATGVAGAHDKQLKDTATHASWGQEGFNYKDGGTLKTQKATLSDQPETERESNNASQIFESAALGVEGTQKDVYMGSVSWGWTVDNTGKLKKEPLKLASKGDPSPTFTAAARQWNKTSVGGQIRTVRNETPVYDNTYTVAFKVAKDTKIEITGSPSTNHDKEYLDIKITNGPKQNSIGMIEVNDLKESGGTPVIKLPIPK